MPIPPWLPSPALLKQSREATTSADQLSTENIHINICQAHFIHKHTVYALSDRHEATSSSGPFISPVLPLCRAQATARLSGCHKETRTMCSK